MKNNTHYYIFDIDGTIAENSLPVSPEICQQLERLSEHRQIIFASARPVRDMLPMLPQSLHQSAIFIGCNGSMAYQNGEFLFANTLPKEAASRIIHFLQRHQVPYVLDGKWGYALSDIPHLFHAYIDKLSDAKIEESQLMAEGITKILVLSNHYKAEVQALSDNSLNVHQHKQEDIYDITPPNNNKYATLQKIIPNQPYIAFGNDQNDFLMLDHSQTAIFLGEKQDYPQADFYLTTKEIADFLVRHF